MGFVTVCPECGGSLSVVQLSWVGKMPLHEDGFSFDEGKSSMTDNEIVKCDSCGKEFDLSDLDDEKLKR